MYGDADVGPHWNRRVTDFVTARAYAASVEEGRKPTHAEQSTEGRHLRRRCRGRSPAAEPEAAHPASDRGDTVRAPSSPRSGRRVLDRVLHTLAEHASLQHVAHGRSGRLRALAES